MKILLRVKAEFMMAIKILNTFPFVSDWFWQLRPIYVLEDKLESIGKAAVWETDVGFFFEYPRR